MSDEAVRLKRRLLHLLDSKRRAIHGAQKDAVEFDPSAEQSESQVKALQRGFALSLSYDLLAELRDVGVPEKLLDFDLSRPPKNSDIVEIIAYLDRSLAAPGSSKRPPEKHELTNGAARFLELRPALLEAGLQMDVLEVVPLQGKPTTLARLLFFLETEFQNDSVRIETPPAHYSKRGLAQMLKFGKSTIGGYEDEDLATWQNLFNCVFRRVLAERHAQPEAIEKLVSLSEAYFPRFFS